MRRYFKNLHWKKLCATLADLVLYAGVLLAAQLLLGRLADRPTTHPVRRGIRYILRYLIREHSAQLCTLLVNYTRYK